MHPFLFHIISILVRIYMLMLHAFTARRSVYEPCDTVQNGRFTVTHTHTHILLKEGLMILNLLPLRRVY